MDGVNLIPYLTGEKAGAPHERLFWRTGGLKGMHAVRQGSWKFVQRPAGEPELYDLAADIGESKNIASSKPELVTEITAAIAEWEKGTIAPTFESPKAGKPVPKKKAAK